MTPPLSHPTVPATSGAESSAESGGVCIVVPIFNAFEAVQGCVASLLRHTTSPRRIILLDDASTDRRLRAALDSWEAGEVALEVSRHSTNRGYTATINHGCHIAGRDDVILLNSDTVVTPGWLDKLAATARSRPNVATVTPLSNAAGAFSVPDNHRRNRIPDGLTIDTVGRLVEQLSDRLRPQVPTGNGFCLYLRRAALDAVGPFDERSFPHGCGEENDFCLRAGRLGFAHLIEDATYVFHHRSASLGWRKRLLLWTSGWQIQLRYPEYRRQVAAWLADDPLDPLRDRLRRRLQELAAMSTRRG